MAAPISKDSSDLSGLWHLNRELSEDPDKIFALQCVPWVVRKILKYANLSLHITQSTANSEENPFTTLHIKQTVHPGGFNSEGSYPVNGEAKDFSLPIFGEVNMMLRYMDATEIEDETLRQKMSQEGLSKTVIYEVAHNTEKKWEAKVVWGFENIKGERYLTRNVKTWNEKETLVTRMVYDWKS